MPGMERRFAKEIAAAIARAAAQNSLVQAWRELAQAAGFEVTLPLEAALASGVEVTPLGLAEERLPSPPSADSFHLTAMDIRLLKSLRIGVERPSEARAV